MNNFLLIPVAVLYLAVVGLLFVFGVNFFYLTLFSLVRRERAAGPVQGNWPKVTVQLPIYNERYVAVRLLNAVSELNYPQDRLEIQVLDDSTDDTSQRLNAAVEKLAQTGINVQYLHRAERRGFKAGALAEGMRAASGDFLAIFDADFVPPKDFLRQVIPTFRDEKVAFVQTRWGHLNRNFSFLTLMQSIAIDAHFMVEQYSRFHGGFWFNFNGTAGVWRKNAIIDAGGWKSDTLTEDLDLSYRAFLKGWRAVYLRDVVAPAELPISFSAYRRQQNRWAQGSLKCAQNLVPVVWRSEAGFWVKVQSTLHLFGYGVHLLLFCLALLYPLVIGVSQEFSGLISLFGIAAVFNLTAFAPTIFFLTAQRELGSKWWRVLPAILFITILGTGMMLNTARAALQLIRGKERPFERTPKFGVFERDQAWQNNRYRLKLDPIVYFEIVFACFNFFTLFYGFHVGNWVVAVYAGIFGLGSLFAAGVSIIQEFGRLRSRSGKPQVESARAEGG